MKLVPRQIYSIGRVDVWFRATDRGSSSDKIVAAQAPGATFNHRLRSQHRPASRIRPQFSSMMLNSMTTDSAAATFPVFPLRIS